jgi:hypothetical protein
MAQDLLCRQAILAANHLLSRIAVLAPHYILNAVSTDLHVRARCLFWPLSLNTRRIQAVS